MAKGRKINTVAAVSELAAPLAASLGLELWDVLYLKEGPSWFLRIFIDKPGGVNIDDCEKMSRALDPLLDELDPCEGEYFLEVSSPGLGRQLRTDAHLQRFVGQKIALRLIRPDQNGERDFAGTLQGFGAETLTLLCPDGEREINRKDAAFVKACDDDYLGDALK